MGKNTMVYKYTHTHTHTGTATPAKMRLAKTSLHKIPYTGTPSADLLSWTVRRYAGG